jgi:hypothetical protein
MHAHTDRMNIGQFYFLLLLPLVMLTLIIHVSILSTSLSSIIFLQYYLCSQWKKKLAWAASQEVLYFRSEARSYSTNSKRNLKTKLESRRALLSQNI